MVSSGLRPAQEAEADRGARQVQEGQHRRRVALVADGEPAEAVHPSGRPFHIPPVRAKAMARVHAAPGEARGGAPAPENPPERRRVVPLSPWSFAGRRRGRPGSATGRQTDGVGQRLEELGVVHVDRRDTRRSRRALAVHEQVVLGARVAQVGLGQPACDAAATAALIARSRPRRFQPSRLARKTTIRSRSGSTRGTQPVEPRCPVPATAGRPGPVASDGSPAPAARAPVDQGRARGCRGVSPAASSRRRPAPRPGWTLCGPRPCPPAGGACEPGPSRATR
jgi:hypothetical protein